VAQRCHLGVGTWLLSWGLIYEALNICWLYVGREKGIYIHMTYCLLYIYIYADVIEWGGVRHRGNLTNKHGQRRNSSRQKEVTFPKAQSNCFIAGQAIYVVCPESRMKTSTGIGSSLVIYCLQRPSRTYPQTPLGRWRRRLKAIVVKKGNWGHHLGTLLEPWSTSKKINTAVGRALCTWTQRHCDPICSLPQLKHDKESIRSRGACETAASGAQLMALAQHQGHVKVSHGTCNEANAKY